MPAIRKLTPEDVKVIQAKGKPKEASQRRLVEEEYDRYLADLSVGDYAEVSVGEGEIRTTIVNRFKTAAKRRGITLRFIRTSGNDIRFEVTPGTPVA